MLEFKGKNYGFDTLMVHAGTQPNSHIFNLLSIP